LLALLNEDVDFEMDLNKPGDDEGLLVFRCGVSCKAKLLGGTSLVNTHFSLSSSCVYLFINNLPALVRKEAKSLAFIRGLFEIGGFKEEVLLLLSKFNDKGDALNEFPLEEGVLLNEGEEDAKADDDDDDDDEGANCVKSDNEVVLSLTELRLAPPVAPNNPLFKLLLLCNPIFNS
jgi:hypothetical protein